MDFLKNIFRKKETPISTYQEFWDWFINHEKVFFNTVKGRQNIDKDFFEKLSPKLNELKNGIFYLTGMLNDNTADLILTPDGNINNIAFVEELVGAAPRLANWKFTALKPASDIKNTYIEMGGYRFDDQNISFYSNDNTTYPDEIDITVVHNDLNEQNRNEIINGVYIFIDNFIGELNFITTIDEITVVGRDDAKSELVPISKLKDFLTWRQAEFIEKYEHITRDISEDNYSLLEATLKSGNAMLATINTGLLYWDNKVSHPWIVNVEIKYNGSKNNGMPDQKTYKLLDAIEEEIFAALPDTDGYLNIGRQTADGLRVIFIACKDFRKPSLLLYKLKQKFQAVIDIDYNIYKDKYWQSFNRFIAH
ncbi:DUF695 domain-containing protein [Mucilaginibacter sp. cycad4]|uniref:DUF695 domain-containing protein n=1 Tax=Mucilaginibacter sp. cycad4 TaxID=3342096 RepID=UPI002AABC220|nr:DUF695 domain-containing protein [Mucilaginibacter gossypii]WPU98581.1 DUF695 domain-containing protein [Mucilaginibacter gossypii]